MAETVFTLGECDAKGKKYRFDYRNGAYQILEVLPESETRVLETVNNSQEAYDKWNAIKRPEKARKNL